MIGGLLAEASSMSPTLEFGKNDHFQGQSVPIDIDNEENSLGDLTSETETEVGYVSYMSTNSSDISSNPPGNPAQVDEVIIEEDDGDFGGDVLINNNFEGKSVDMKIEGEEKLGIDDNNITFEDVGFFYDARDETDIDPDILLRAAELENIMLIASMNNSSSSGGGIPSSTTASSRVRPQLDPNSAHAKYIGERNLQTGPMKDSIKSRIDEFHKELENERQWKRHKVTAD